MPRPSSKRASSSSQRTTTPDSPQMDGNTCYYEVLGISRSASSNDVNKAYRKMALKWHPDKNPDNKEQATAMFQLISNAYEVLSNEDKRKIYDVHGRDGLCSNTDSGSHATNGFHSDMPSFFTFSHGGNRGTGGGFHFRDPFDVFRDVFSMFGFPDDDLYNMMGISRPRPSQGQRRHTTLEVATFNPMSPFTLLSSDLANPFGMHDAVMPFGSMMGGGSSSFMMSSFGSGGMGSTMMSGSSTSTQIINGHRVTTKKTVTNGRETVKVYEDDQLTMHTVDGVAQPISQATSPAHQMSNPYQIRGSSHHGHRRRHHL